MKLKKLNSNKEVDVNLAKYRIKWDAPCRSEFQYNVKQWFRKYWQNQVCLEEFRIPGTLLKVDLVNLNKRILVEINGAQHDNFNEHFHRGSRANFFSQIQRDSKKRLWAEHNGFLMVEIEPDDLPLTLDFFRRTYQLEII